MHNKSFWLSSRTCCCQQTSRVYIYLYSPTMTNSSRSIPSRCLACLLVLLCLVLISILTVLIVYYHRTHLHTSRWSASARKDTLDMTWAKKRHLPDFVNTSIDPCEYFLGFVCNSWTSPINYDDNDFEKNSARIRRVLHEKLMMNISQLSSSLVNGHSQSK
jgi:hypothetical protein